MPSSVRIGIHLSIATSLADAAERAHSLGARALQIFTSSPRMWRTSQLKPDDIALFQELRQRYDIRPLVVHNNYLTNLAASDPVTRRNSIAAFRSEVQRSDAVGADYLVAHPGSARGQLSGDALRSFGEALEAATENIGSVKVKLLLECTAGQGETLGASFEQLAALREEARHRTSLAIGYCLDTCHLFAAGYDIRSGNGLEDTLRQTESTIGLDNVPVFHTNDSKAPFGSRRDRHEQIGKGEIGARAFGRILRHPKLAGKAFILETPVVEPGDDRRNIQKLIRLARVT